MRLYELFKRQEVDQSLPYDEIDIYNAGADHKTRDEKWRGPHSGRYIILMLRGVKPMMLIDADEMITYQKYVDSGKLTKHKIIIRNNFLDFALTLPGQEWRAVKLQKLYDQMDDYFAAGKENLWHARQGMLLGYSNSDIRKFLNQ